MEKRYLPKAARRHAKRNEIDKWVGSFLGAKGGNKALADGLNKQKRYWFGPEQFQLTQLKRCCGPEKDMEYHESQDDWANRVNTLASSIRRGNELPPLIAEWVDGQLIVRDGNHRYEAYVQAGFDRYWTIIWFNSKNDKNLFERKFNR